MSTPDLPADPMYVELGKFACAYSQMNGALLGEIHTLRMIVRDLYECGAVTNWRKVPNELRERVEATRDVQAFRLGGGRPFEPPVSQVHALGPFRETPERPP